MGSKTCHTKLSILGLVLSDVPINAGCTLLSGLQDRSHEIRYVGLELPDVGCPDFVRLQDLSHETKYVGASIARSPDQRNVPRFLRPQRPVPPN